EIAQAIIEKKAQYCRFADSQKWDLFDKVVLPDFRFEFIDNGVVPKEAVFPLFQSREACVAHFSKLLAVKQAHHLVGSPELEQVSSDEVKAVFPIHYYIADKGPIPKPESRITGGAHYHEVFKRVGDEWFLADLKVVHTF
ncbi:hypothetical protein M406DRAFT_234253, partial [Cryphonectria parasitica EP155]